MSNPALHRSGDTDHPPGRRGGEGEMPVIGAFAAHSTSDLIALRDGLLAECLELENRARGAEGAAGEGLPDPETIRERIDEIHQEMAIRDLAERVGVERPSPGRAPAPSCGTDPGLAAGAAQRSIQILEAIEMRSRFMDELAHAARTQGRLDQAAAFTLNAQKLDMERVEVLGRLSALAAKPADTDV